MNVLVSLEVLVAYLFSMFVTFFAPQVETSYDAAALQVTFVLFGYWIVMRCRRGISDALNGLLPLVPSQANVIHAIAHDENEVFSLDFLNIFKYSIEY